MADSQPGSARIVNLMDYRQARAARVSEGGESELPRLSARPPLSERAVLHRQRMLAHLKAQLNRRTAR
jgi:hypothetical protein